MRNDFLSHTDAALRNRNSILSYVRYHENVSRTDIWEAMNISRASVTQVIRQLLESNLIREVGEGQSTGGRKPTYIVFNGEAKKLYIFDWMHRTLYLTDLGGQILYEEVLSFHKDIQPDVFSAVLLERIATVDAMGLCDLSEIIGIGLAMPGLVDSRNCTVIHSVELGWQSVCMRELLDSRFGEAVYLERSGNALALGAYYHGRHRQTNHFQLFIVGHDGIGMSTIIHGNCQHGANYMHGELGHIKLPGDALCSCGQRGCLEASVKALLERSGGRITEEILEYLAIGVSTCVNISDADSVLLVGSYVEQMTQEQRQQLKEFVLSKVTSRHMRMLDVRLEPDTRELTRKGIREYLFEKTFPTD